jgi:hypothetical protein
MEAGDDRSMLHDLDVAGIVSMCVFLNRRTRLVASALKRYIWPF